MSRYFSASCLSIFLSITGKYASILKKMIVCVGVNVFILAVSSISRALASILFNFLELCSSKYIVCCGCVVRLMVTAQGLLLTSEIKSGTLINWPFLNPEIFMILEETL